MKRFLRFVASTIVAFLHFSSAARAGSPNQSPDTQSEPRTAENNVVASPNTKMDSFQDIISDAAADPIDSSVAPAYEDPNYGPKRAVLGLEAQGYMYSPQTQQEEILPSIWGKFKDSGDIMGAQGHISFQALAILPPAGSGFYYEAPEAYIGAPIANSAVRVDVGRKLEHWNLLDERWQLGIWQPRFLWDYIHPEEVGLTGVFLSAEGSGVRFVVFGSPLFVPERGVPINIENGQLTSQSPFFVSPPSNVQVLGVPTTVDYQLNVPSISSIILHPSAGYLLHVGENTGPWIQGAQSFSPMNQLITAYSPSLVTTSNTSSVEIPVYPRVMSHYLTSVDMGYQVGIFSATLSSLWDVPIQQTIASNLVSESVIPSLAISPSVDLRFHIPNWGMVHTYLSFLGQWGGNAPDVAGPTAVQDITANAGDERYPYQRAYMIGGESGVPGASYLGAWADHVAISARLLYDITHRGTILSADVRFQPLARWQINFGADLLGSTEELAAGQSPVDLIGRYKANDDFRGGLSYAF
ncbi:MAG: hypothetical protein P4M08_09770 [Oligoflexia bacterium]|nr:hypothetical protein [Oligoflexia bacterium]